MGGEDNFSTAGWPNKDSDVYGNKVTHTWDDGLEIEGGDQNVRVWGNYVDQSGTAISSTIDSVGPLYVFRNVWDRNEFIEGAACDSDQKQPMFKSGSSSDFANGRRYLFHNTMLQRTQPGCTNGRGGGAGVGGTGDSQLVHNTISMNNIYAVWKSQNTPFYQVGSDNTFQNDMMTTAGSPETGAIVGKPTYAAGNGDNNADGGLYQLAAGSKGFDQGVRIPNFNDHFNGAAPDVGAAEAGDNAMKFGIAAASASTSVGGQGSGTTTTTGGGSTGSGDTGSSGNGSSGNGSSGNAGSGGSGSSSGSGSTGSGSEAVSATMDSTAYTTSKGDKVTFTVAAMGNSGTPGGTVNFTANGATIPGCGAIALSGGKAACTTASLKPGSWTIRGVYSGDSTYGAGLAGPITETVN
jgi:hypothetical protein